MLARLSVMALVVFLSLPVGIEFHPNQKTSILCGYGLQFSFANGRWHVEVTKRVLMRRWWKAWVKKPRGMWRKEWRSRHWGWMRNSHWMVKSRCVFVTVSHGDGGDSDLFFSCSCEQLRCRRTVICQRQVADSVHDHEYEYIIV